MATATTRARTRTRTRSGLDAECCGRAQAPWMGVGEILVAEVPLLERMYPGAPQRGGGGKMLLKAAERSEEMRRGLREQRTGEFYQ